MLPRVETLSTARDATTTDATDEVLGNDGGRDAPLTPRGRLIYRSALLGLVVVFLVLLALTLHVR